jgi:uncharacterized phage protein gp47/JayE
LADRYITYPLVADARDLMQRCFDYMTSVFPGWEPSEGQLDTALIEGISSEAADIATLTTEIPKTIFRYFGAQLMGVVPQDAVAATATSTWYAIDTNGYMIPDGTQVSIADSSGNPVPFVTLGDAQIPAGQTHTTAGAVTLIAIVPGADSSGVGSVSGPIDLIDVYPWIDHVTQTTVSIGGIDAEADDAYLDRLTQELSTISPRPILPRDFSIIARDIEGVQRATTIDGLNPPSSYNNERMVCVVGLDVNGAGIDSAHKTALQTYLDGLREVNFVVNITDPTVSSANSVDVSATVLMDKNYSSADVHDRVVAAIQAFLNPATWGIDPTDNPNNPTTWNNQTVVRYLDLATAINNVAGVAYTVSVATGLNGGAQAATDKTLTGAAPLPHAGTIAVTVNTP